MNDFEACYMPDAATCTVEQRKISGYLLSETHPDGRGKARFFQQRGFSLEQWPVLAEALKAHPLANPVAASAQSEYGRKYEVRCQLKTPDGRNPCIVTVWITESGEPPRLVTAYPHPDTC